MKQNFVGRLVVIGLCVAVALLAIFWPALARVFSSDPRNVAWHNLKPGIDIAGGVSLLYEIKGVPGETMDENMATIMASNLKRRVDPDGVKNLVWRPQGATRLEIQMPTTGAPEEARKAKDKFQAAQTALSATNIRPGEIDALLVRPDGRDDDIERLSGGSASRKALLTEYVAVSAELAKARADKNLDKVIELEDKPRDLKAKIEATNLAVETLQSILEGSQTLIDKARETGDNQALAKATQDRDTKVAELIGRTADFAGRREAITQYVAAYDEYGRFKNTVEDAEDLKRQLRGAGVLEFHILVTDYSLPEAQAMVRRLQPGPDERGTAVQGGDAMRWYEVDRPDQLKGRRMEDYGGKKWVLAYIGNDAEKKAMVHSRGPKWGLSRASMDHDEMGKPQVAFRFDLQGGVLFGELTGANIQQPLAVVLDEKIISAPTIQSRIETNGVITGDYTQAELSYLINTLNAGSLPAQLTEQPIMERQIGPQIGRDNLRAGLIASAVGLVVVALFLIGYYYMAGVIATIAVTLNFILILGVMAMFNATFTLPGIAAMVLTVGMAVDANVLIFERLREEQHRGLSLKMALRNAYDRAFSAILDSNVTTAITSLILYWLGSEEVKGFGLTLLIGILSSLFTALFVTRTLFEIMMDKFNLKKLGSLPLTFPNWDRMLKPKIDWMRLSWGFYAFSAVFIVAGLSAFLLKGRDMFDIEFVSGTAVQFELKEDMKRDQVQGIISAYEAKGLPSAQVVAVGTGLRSYEVLTPNDKSAEVKEAILKALEGKLNVEQPSRYDGVPADLAAEAIATTFDEARAAGILVPINDASRNKLIDAGVEVATIQKYQGGVAIILKNLSPPLSAEQIEARLSRARLQQSDQKFRYTQVLTAGLPSAPSPTAVVVVSDDSLSFDREEAKWNQDLAMPMWKLVAEAVNRPAELQKVVAFDPSIAAETLQAAVTALIVSVILISIYLWIRFGNLKYGTATVVALLHDTLITIGAVGLSHYIAGTAIGDALLVEPFRMNLTMIAAVLTVMGYSMNDTIVVFDRIRENRGKFGHISRDIINDSVNQTLSRTLLTGGTTIITIFLMYILGGPGIHGFTFALLVGILVGTYSSIAIASPILLWGRDKGEVAASKASVQVQRVGG